MLILASASPRRRELLTQAGFTYEIRAASIDESVLAGEDPVAYVTRLAREKAQAVFDGLGAAQTGAVVLGADTTVTIDGAILGKPADAEEARQMLRRLAGRVHRVATGVAVVSAQGVTATAETTAVEFLPMSEEKIAGYVASGEPMDKAGAYGIQGRAARWIPRIEGCYYNVMGLPLARVAAMLVAAGVR